MSILIASTPENLLLFCVGRRVEIVRISNLKNLLSSENTQRNSVHDFFFCVDPPENPYPPPFPPLFEQIYNSQTGTSI